jgi:hypothetical protein
MECIIDRIDFGHNDAKREINLLEYFYDVGFSKAILNENKFIVLGRKGSGKTAIARYFELRAAKLYNCFSLTLSFKDYSFVKAYKTYDSNFSSPNQYKSIWRYVILIELLGILMQREGLPYSEEHSNLYKFYKKNYDARKINFKYLVDQMLERKFKLDIPFGFGVEYGTKKTDGYEKRHYLEILDDLETNVLEVIDDKEYLIQFDELDEDYQDDTNYSSLIISLFKTAASLNTLFHENNKNVKVIVYLRSDIYNSFYDNDLNKFTDDIFELNWYEEGVSQNSKLKNMINKRIAYSLKLPTDYNKDLWDEIFSKGNIIRDLNAYSFIIEKTFHRPRDIIQYCKICQKHSKGKDIIDLQSVLDSEAEYSRWFKKEIRDELFVRLGGVDQVFEILRRISTQIFTIHEFDRNKKYFGFLRQYSTNKLLTMLFDASIIGYIIQEGGRNKVFFKYRNEDTEIKFDAKFVIHRGFLKGLQLT